MAPELISQVITSPRSQCWQHFRARSPNLSPRVLCTTRAWQSFRGGSLIGRGSATDDVSLSGGVSDASPPATPTGATAVPSSAPRPAGRKRSSHPAETPAPESHQPGSTGGRPRSSAARGSHGKRGQLSPDSAPLLQGRRSRHPPEPLRPSPGVDGALPDRERPRGTFPGSQVVSRVGVSPHCSRWCSGEIVVRL